MKWTNGFIPNDLISRYCTHKLPVSEYLNIFKTVAIVSFMTLWYIINKGHVIMKGIGKR